MTEKEFRDYLSFFLHDNLTLNCSKGGHAAHGSSVKLYEHTGTMETSLTVGYHSLLISSADFIDSMHQAFRLTDNITATLRKAGHDVEVFSYRYENYNEFFSLSLGYSMSSTNNIPPFGMMLS